MPPKSTTRRTVVSSLTVEQLANDWFRAMRARNLSPHTLRTREQAIRLFRAYLQEQEISERIADITRRNVEEFMILLTVEYAPGTQLTRYNSLNVFFNWCVEEEELDYSPMARIKKPEVPDLAPTLLTRAEIEALLRTCSGKAFHDRRDRAIFLLLIDTGMRLDEISQLTLDTVNMEAQTLAIIGKGRRPRTPHFDMTAGAAMAAYLRARTRFVNERPLLARERAFWLGKRGALTNSGIFQTIKKRARQAGIAGVHPHLFRHGFADAWLAGGGTEGDLARLAGWTPGSSMLHRYGAAQAEDRAREAHKRLSPANRLAQPAPPKR